MTDAIHGLDPADCRLVIHSTVEVDPGDAKGLSRGQVASARRLGVECTGTPIFRLYLSGKIRKSFDIRADGVGVRVCFPMLWKPMRHSIRNLAIRNLLIALAMVVTSSAAFAQVDISVSFGPPALPIYEQPMCPDAGYLWAPGYWAWDPDFGDYYWVPGTWVEAPEVGYLWTPGYWGWGGGGFLFHQGYWGPHVGFYGGINYGYGYFGNGFEGGRWQGREFFYNRAVMNVNVVNIHNVYNTTIVNNRTINRISYNGGEGGIAVRATPEQLAVEQERHIPPVAAQVQHRQTALSNPELRASVNHGKPPIAATARPAAFTGEGVVQAKEAGAPYHPPAKSTAPAKSTEGPPRANPPVHASDLQPHQAPTVQTGNPEMDKKYQQQQNQLMEKQNQQHIRLQQQQDLDHQRLVQKNANDAMKQQVEVRHQQQTVQMEQKHTQQQQHLQQREPTPHVEEKPR